MRKRKYNTNEECKKDWAKNNPEKIKESYIKWRDSRTEEQKLNKKIKMREYREKNRSKIKQARERMKIEEPEKWMMQKKKEADKKRDVKLEVIRQYGGFCVCCGEDRWEFLTIDHINGNGGKHRKEVGAGTAFYYWLRKNSYPKNEYRLLCYNCNCVRGRLGYCPHEKEGVVLTHAS